MRLSIILPLQPQQDGCSAASLMFCRSRHASISTSRRLTLNAFESSAKETPFAVRYFRELWRLFSDRRKCLAVRVANTQMELQEVS